MKQDGLERNRWIEPIEDFVRQHSCTTPRWAIFLTYEFDPARFSRSVLPLLSRKGRCFRTVVLADQGALEKSLEISCPKLTGAVNLHPVRCHGRGVFHPKLVFLRAGPHVRACFGSANLTGGGLGSNLELWSSTESPEVLGGIAHFLDTLVQSRALALDDGARRSLRRALGGLIGAKSDSVWSSLQGTFTDRIRAGPESKAGEVIAISPMFTGKGGVQDARSAFRCPDFRLYTDEPASVPKCKGVFLYSPQDSAIEGDGDIESLPTQLHAKAYVFRPKASGPTVVWLGSANFTTRALKRPIAKGGNVELMVRTRLPNDEADALHADLNELFKKSDSGIAGIRRKETPPKPLATVLACELTGLPGHWKLAIQATQQTGHVILQHEKQRVYVSIKKGRGTVAGAKLERLIPQLDDPKAAQVLVLFEVLKDGRKVPIVVNIPHVPPDDGEGQDAGAQLDWLLDELLGRVRPVRPHSGSGDELEQADPDSETDIETDSEESDFGRRLDLVRRQGELDQLAVKAALLKKLICRSASCEERARLVHEYAIIMLAATPIHLRPSIRAHFGL